MTFLEAAIKVLYDNGNIPMSHMEIWDIINKQKLVESNGKTPWASLNTIILYSCVNSPIDPKYLDKTSDKTRNIFDIVGKPMKFKLNDSFLEKRFSEKLITPKQIESVEAPKPIDPPKQIEPGKTLIHQVTTEDLNWKTLQVFKNEHGDIEFDIVENVGGYTYLLDEPVSKRVKIGYSKNPNGRIATHQTSNTNLEHIIVFPTSLYSERSLHQRFSSYRDIQCRAKEFFFRTKELDDFIKEELDKQENTLSFYDIHKEYAINKENFIKKLK